MQKAEKTETANMVNDRRIDKQCDVKNDESLLWNRGDHYHYCPVGVAYIWRSDQRHTVLAVCRITCLIC